MIGSGPPRRRNTRQRATYTHLVIGILGAMLSCLLALSLVPVGVGDDGPAIRIDEEGRQPPAASGLYYDRLENQRIPAAGPQQESEQGGDQEDDQVSLSLGRIPLPHLNRSGFVTNYVVLDLDLALAHKSDEKQVATMLPIIREAVLKSLSRGRFSRADAPGGLDEDAVSKTALSAANGVLDNDLIAGVVVTNSFEAPR